MIERLPLWRNRDYMLLWSGQALSLLGTEASQLAFPLLILALTGSPAQAGIASALRAFAYLLFSLPAGAIVDRWDRRHLMIVCDSGRALVLGSIPLAFLLGHLTIIQLYLVSLIEGMLFVFFDLAAAACLPRLVLKEQLPSATAQDEVMRNTAFLVGPPLGGLLYQVGHVLPFLADALSYVWSTWLLLLIKTPFQQERTATPRKLHAEILEGLSWLWHQPLIHTMVILGSGFNFVFAGQTLIVIILARQQHVLPVFIGLIFTIAGGGGIVGALCGPFLQRRLSFGQGIIGACWMYALLWALYAIGPNVVVLCAVTTGFFLVSPIYDVVQFSYSLALVPDALQGRVRSASRMVMYTLIALGQALTGIMLQHFGPLPTVLLFWIGILTLAVLATVSRHIRHAPPLTQVQS